MFKSNRETKHAIDRMKARNKEIAILNGKIESNTMWGLLLIVLMLVFFFLIKKSSGVPSVIQITVPFLVALAVIWLRFKGLDKKRTEFELDQFTTLSVILSHVAFQESRSAAYQKYRDRVKSLSPDTQVPLKYQSMNGKEFAVLLLLEAETNKELAKGLQNKNENILDLFMSKSNYFGQDEKLREALYTHLSLELRDVLEIYLDDMCR